MTTREDVIFHWGRRNRTVAALLKEYQQGRCSYVEALQDMVGALAYQVEEHEQERNEQRGEIERLQRIVEHRARARERMRRIRKARQE